MPLTRGLGSNDAQRIQASEQSSMEVAVQRTAPDKKLSMLDRIAKGRSKTTSSKMRGRSCKKAKQDKNNTNNIERLLAATVQLCIQAGATLQSKTSLVVQTWQCFNSCTLADYFEYLILAQYSLMAPGAVSRAFSSSHSSSASVYPL